MFILIPLVEIQLATRCRSVVVLFSTSPGRSIVYKKKYKVSWSTLLQPERPPEPTPDVCRSMLGAKVAILKLTHILHVASKGKVWCPNPSKSQRRVLCWSCYFFVVILRLTRDPIISTHVVFVANLCDVTRKELNVSYGTTHATLV